MDIREKILTANDRRFEIVNVPEWGCDVYVYEMTTGDRNRLMRDIAKADGALPVDYFARLVYMCACDESGTRIFSERDIDALQDRSGTATRRITDVASSLNSLNGDAEAEAEKNSETTQDGSGDTE